MDTIDEISRLSKNLPLVRRCPDGDAADVHSQCSAAPRCMLGLRYGAGVLLCARRRQCCSFSPQAQPLVLICGDNNLLYSSPRHVRQRPATYVLLSNLPVSPAPSGGGGRSKASWWNLTSRRCCCVLAQFCRVVQENEAAVGGFCVLIIIIMVIIKLIIITIIKIIICIY